MKYDPDKHNRQSLRLKHYDYGQAGYYFVTIVTQHRQEIFGEIDQGLMYTNAAGQMVSAQWQALSGRFPQIALDAFVVMPNHVHGVIVIQKKTPPSHSTPVSVPAGAGLVPALNFDRRGIGVSTRDTPTGRDTLAEAQSVDEESKPIPDRPTLGDIVGAFKSLTTHDYIMGVRNRGWTPFDKRLWQRNYHEHIIRNKAALNRIRAYIQNNPQKWSTDREHLPR